MLGFCLQMKLFCCECDVFFCDQFFPSSESISALAQDKGSLLLFRAVMGLGTWKKAPEDIVVMCEWNAHSHTIAWECLLFRISKTLQVPIVEASRSNENQALGINWFLSCRQILFWNHSVTAGTLLGEIWEILWWNCYPICHPKDSLEVLRFILWILDLLEWNTYLFSVWYIVKHIGEIPVRKYCSEKLLDWFSNFGVDDLMGKELEISFSCEVKIFYMYTISSL